MFVVLTARSPLPSQKASSKLRLAHGKHVSFIHCWSKGSPFSLHFAFSNVANLFLWTIFRLSSSPAFQGKYGKFSKWFFKVPFTSFEMNGKYTFPLPHGKYVTHLLFQSYSLIPASSSKNLFCVIWL